MMNENDPKNEFEKIEKDLKIAHSGRINGAYAPHTKDQSLRVFLR